MKKLIMFDCFGVILDEIMPIWFEKRYPADEADRLKHHFFDGADLGEKSLLGAFREMSAELGVPYETIIREYEEMIAVKEGTVAILDALRRDFREEADIILVSNCTEGNLDQLFVPRGLDRRFDRLFESWRCRMAKPDPAFYRFCIDSMKKDYEAICMIDDNPKNLEPLPALGVRPILFTSPEKLKEELSDFLGSPISF